MLRPALSAHYRFLGSRSTFTVSSDSPLTSLQGSSIKQSVDLTTTLLPSGLLAGRDRAQPTKAWVERDTKWTRAPPTDSSGKCHRCPQTWPQPRTGVWRRPEAPIRIRSRTGPLRAPRYMLCHTCPQQQAKGIAWEYGKQACTPPRGVDDLQEPNLRKSPATLLRPAV